jgi:peptidoglycan/xylan/chitin deacetylase (PgdA/CDA1 family)
MIGVIVDSGDRETAREFFELFKTPWEFYRQDRNYEVLLCVGDGKFDKTAKLGILYASSKTEWDDDHQIECGCQQKPTRTLLYQGNRIPIYGYSVTFPDKREGLLTDEDSHQPMAHIARSGEGWLARIGYDLLAEIRTLLTAGQPSVNASIPTLELHIALLRRLITESGVRLVEIPPVPDGYRFIACLTHDIDHPSIRRHKWDHTTLGFLYRAGFGSLWGFIRRRITIRNVLKNWMAALKLPFVQFGLAKDFWLDFDDRYLKLENGLRSTFFVIPFENRPGESSRSRASLLRGARYGARDIATTIQRLLSAGCEVGLHGIDAWRDSAIGRQELEEIRHVTRVSEIGVRMHWLFYDQHSPLTLEKAGASYDSTIGYNITVGYRTGTTQVYKPFQARRLLELPLHVMDTALFYPAYLGLSPKEAEVVLDRMVKNAAEFGGCLAINWHDRSLAPERLWDACYRDLIQNLRDRGAWFATAGEAVAWFRKRRSAVFERDSKESGSVRAGVPADSTDRLPGLRLRLREAGQRGEMTDRTVKESVDAVGACRPPLLT